MPSPDRAAVLFRADAPVAGELALEVLLAGGERKKLSDAERRDLLARVRAGEHVELSFTARTFVQTEGKANRNFIRFKPSALGKIARSFKGQPFLRDHSQRTLDARGGTITSSQLVEDADGTLAIEMTVKVFEPWAVSGLLTGKIDRFSIGWHPTGPVLCSVHRTRIFRKCECWPGDVVAGFDEDDPASPRVEAVFTSADGVEVSAVNVPAVPEAKGVEIRAALEALGALGADDNEAAPRRLEARMEKIIAILGLAAAATGDDITAAITALKDENATLRVKLGASEERLRLAEAKVAELDAAQAAEAAKALSARVDGDIDKLYATGRLIRQDGQPAALEAHLRSMVSTLGYEAFAAYIKEMPALAPIGGPMQSASVGKDKKGPAAAITPELKAALAACGLTEDDYLKYGPHKRALTGGN